MCRLACFKGLFHRKFMAYSRLFQAKYCIFFLGDLMKKINIMLVIKTLTVSAFLLPQVGFLSAATALEVPEINAYAQYRLIVKTIKADELSVKNLSKPKTSSENTRSDKY